MFSYGGFLRQLMFQGAGVEEICSRMKSGNFSLGPLREGLFSLLCFLLFSLFLVGFDTGWT